MAARKAWVYGPYEHGTQFRLVFIDGRGRRHTVPFESRVAAIEARDREHERLAKPPEYSVRQAVDDYLADCRVRGLRSTSIDSTGHRLRTLLQVRRGREGGELRALTPARATALVEQLGADRAYKSGAPRKPRSVDYRRGVVAEAGTWARWLIEQGKLKRDPFDDIKVKGRRRRGKLQLTIEEAQRFAGHCLTAAAGGDLDALAAVIDLYLGPRSSEVTDRLVRDVDQGGSILWIPDSKTEAGKRRLQVPPTVAPLLAALCIAADGKPRPPRDRLFGDRTRHTVYNHVHRLCDEAKVPRVCPQSLRGLHATLATEAGQTSRAVADALGHASPAITRASYIRQGTTERIGHRRALEVLQGGKAS
jgi:integrase